MKSIKIQKILDKIATLWQLEVKLKAFKLWKPQFLYRQLKTFLKSSSTHNYIIQQRVKLKAVG